jgi:hypothetical protein
MGKEDEGGAKGRMTKFKLFLDRGQVVVDQFADHVGDGRELLGEPGNHRVSADGFEGGGFRNRSQAAEVALRAAKAARLFTGGRRLFWPRPR